MGPELMIDLHTHILYGLDDGARSLEESIEMCRMAYQDGVRTVVATPHTLDGLYRNDRATILARVHELNETLVECGILKARPGGGDTQSAYGNLQSAISDLFSVHSELRTPNSELQGSQSAIENQSAKEFRNPGMKFSDSQSAIRNPKSAIENQSAKEFRNPGMKFSDSQSAIRNPKSAIKNQSAKEFRNPGMKFSDSQSTIEGFPSFQSAICNLQSAMSFQVLPGADVSFSSDIVRLFEKGEVTTLNDKGRCIMFEFPSQGIPYRAEEILFQLMAKGIIPIISHPERNLEIARRPERYYEMIRRGCLGQVTAMSLTGGFGSGIKRIAEKLLANRLIHIISSDAHSVDGRPPVLSPAVRAAGKILGMEEAWRMVTEYPQALLEGRRPSLPDPVSP